MNIFKNISIRNKLIIASLIPLLALLYYLQINIRQELSNKNSAQQVIGDVQEIQEISKVIHEFQKERSLTLSFLAGNGTKEKESLSDQWESTDKAISSLEKILKEQNRIIQNYSNLDSLPSVRAKVTAVKPVAEIDVFYTGFKANLLEEVSTILRNSKNLTLKNYFEEYLFLLYAKDFMAQMRGELGGVLTAGKFDGMAYGSFASIKGKHDINLQRFKKIASPEIKDFFDRRYQGPFIQQTYGVIDSAFNDPSFTNFKPDFDTWWSVATSSINSLKEIEDYSIGIIGQKANDELSFANANVMRNAIIAALIILLIIVIVTATVKGIISSISKIKEAADSMAKGNVDVVLDIKTKDEIGDLAASFNVMRSNLRNLLLENDSKNWLLTGNAEINNNMRGEKEARELSQSIINQICTYLDARIGAIYLYENGQLCLTGSYAFQFRKQNANVFKPGEGLVGQAALEKKMIVFTEVPEDYIKINSGLGNTTPKNIIVLPLLLAGEVKGVIELGSVREFSEMHLQFLEAIAENIAIAIAASLNRETLTASLLQIQLQKAETEKISFELNQQVSCLNNAAIVSMTDANGDVTYVNDTFCKISKFSREELIGKNHRILKSGKQPDGLFVGMWKAISTGRIWNGEIHNKAKDGTFYWVDTTITPFKGIDGKIEKYVAIRFDITERKEQAEKLKNLLEETQKQAEELQAQQEELKQSNEELHEKTEMLESSEAELKAQQEELQQTNEELEEKASLLEEQKEKLENAKMDIENKARELEATSRYKSEFLANMSHELRTPLNSILILSQLLSENKSKVLGDKEVEFSKNIYNSGADLLNLINEILDLSKVESGKIELDIAEVPFAEIDTEVNSMFSEVAKNKSIDFTIRHKEGDLKFLTTDKQRLEQILRNLLSNAFKFTPKGGKVTLSIERAASNTSYKNSKLYSVPVIVAISVADTGIGIPNNKLGIVFEAFQQADGSTKRQYGGTGLGLSISRELANALGGEIHAKSEEGKGSRFTLYLPLQFDASVMASVERKEEIKEKKNEHPPKQNQVEKFQVEKGEVNDDRYNIQENDKVILIMEDDKDFSHALLDFVRDRNYKGIVAAQGNTGLSYARHYKPDAILLDMKLPVMEGTEVLKHLKKDPDLRHVPVQIISGYDRRKEGLDLGAFDFIRKPVSKDDLTNAFDKIEDFVSKKLKKLLIVEDNDMQNKAIRELIGNGDVKSISAYSGKEAYEMMTKEDYDCVIVDLGLPDMSGFDLLEKIKTDSRLSRVPIIVYTGKDLSKEENARLMKYANTVVLKTANSHERLLDETMLFLHRVESKLPKEKQNIIRKLHKTDEVLRNKKVLVVDDDIRNIYSLTNVLEEEGMNCLTAENGIAAIKMLKENPGIELVLMDVMMPEMDGYEATKEIRGISKFSKLPVIALTAKAMKGDREKCLASGMSDYIAKPVNIDQLLSLMRVWLYR